MGQTISSFVDDDTAAHIREEAKRRDRSKSYIVRELIKRAIADARSDGDTDATSSAALSGGYKSP